MLKWLSVESNRALVYNVILAVGGLVVFYGVASEEEVALWIGLVMSFAGNGLARTNVSRK